MYRLLIAGFFLFSSAILIGDEAPPLATDSGPWFTGPLLTPAGHVITRNHINVEPYVNVIAFNGVYDKDWHRHTQSKLWSVNPQVFIKPGLSQKWDLSLTLQAFYNRRDGVHSTHIGDTDLELDYQLYSDKPDGWAPAVKLYVYETFPTGHYQKLNPEKLNTDISGAGSFVSGFGVVFARSYHFSKKHVLATRYNLNYAIPSFVQVKGFNTYGGDFDTRGRVKPGQAISGFIGMEYSLTVHWALAFDVEYLHINKSTFSGKTILPVGLHSSEQLSVAPAIEYNWNAHLGIIAGSWFTLMGRNMPAFSSGIVAFNYYY